MQTISWCTYNHKNLNLYIGESANYPGLKLSHLKMSIRKNVHVHIEKCLYPKLSTVIKWTIWNHSEILAKNEEVLSIYNIKFPSSSKSSYLHILMWDTGTMYMYVLQYHHKSYHVINFMVKYLMKE